MCEPIIQANENLLRNGDFAQSLSHWKKGTVKPAWTAVMCDTHNSEPIAYLRTGNGSSAYQTLVVPKESAANVRYSLSFLYETNHTRAGMVLLSIDGETLRQEILLPGKSAQAIEERRRLAAGGQPLALDLSPMQTQLQLDVKAGQTLRVEACSPQNDAGDEYSDLRVTRIELLLHLDQPLQLQELKLDNESVQPDSLLHVCLGADFDSFSGGHRLRFIPRDDSDWLGTAAALTIQDNPQGAIVARPEWANDQPVTAEWQLGCPLIGDDEPYRFTLQWVNQYTAAPYVIDVSLGHHRLVFGSEMEAAYYPVLEYAQSVRLGVQILSYYTSQALSGRTVNWTVEDVGLKGASVTDDNGWAYFDYLPERDGDHTVFAAVDSPYYQSGSVSRAFSVKVLATDPWKEVVAVTESAQAPWPDKTGYPNRGSSYALQIGLPDVLSDTWFSLSWSGDHHEQLGVTIDPPLDAPVSASDGGLIWTLTSEDKFDGQFRLQLVSSKLKLPSPFKPMSLARNVVKIGEVREANKFPVVDEQESVLLRVQVLHDVALGNGDPVVNAQVEWQLPDAAAQTVVTGAGGWASVLYTPTSAGEKVITAKVQAHSEAAAVERTFSVTALASSPWANQVDILLDGIVVDRKMLGVLCWRGQSHTLKVEALPGSTLIGKNISLNWRGSVPQIGLSVSDLGITRPLPADGGLSWQLSSEESNSVSSLFDLKLSSAGFADRELSGRLIAPDLSREMSVVLDQVIATAGQTLYPCLGAVHRYAFQTHALSPLVGLGVPLACSVEPQKPGATVEPDFGVEQILGDGGASWTFDFTGSLHPDNFELSFYLPALQKLASSNPIALGHNRLKFEASRESAVDPVVGETPAWQWARVISHYTDAPVAGVPVQWNGTQWRDTDGDGWSGFAFTPDAAGAHEVIATVVSPYDGYHRQQSTTVRALASDPWKDLSVSFDNGEFHPWGQKTAFPRRRGRHRIELSAPAGNALIGSHLMLGMTGSGPAELGIRFESGKGLGTPIVFYGGEFLYSFDVGDIDDGSFNLRLAAERLVSLSPANAMSVGSANQVVEFAERTRNRPVLDWNQQLVEQVTLVSSITGKPMVGVEVTWTHEDLGTETSVTDFYGVARMRFTPRTPGPSVLTAAVGSDGSARSLGLDFTLNEPREVLTLTLLETSGYPGERMSAEATVVSALTGKPLPHVEVMWLYNDVEFPPTLTDTEGKAHLEFTLDATGESVLTAMIKGGEAGWDSKSTPVLVLEEDVRLEVLSTDKTTLYQGDAVSATAKAVYSRNGSAAKGVQVSWHFAQMIVLPSVTDEEGRAIVEFKPAQIGTFDLTARVERSEAFKAQSITVLDPLSSPDHALIKQVVVQQSPIGPDNFANVKAFVVSTATGLPMIGRDVQVTTSFMSAVTVKTDREGKVEIIWRPMQTGTLSFLFTVTNPGGTTSNWAASVEVI